MFFSLKKWRNSKNNAPSKTWPRVLRFLLIILALMVLTGLALLLKTPRRDETPLIPSLVRKSKSSELRIAAGTITRLENDVVVLSLQLPGPIDGSVERKARITEKTKFMKLFIDESGSVIQRPIAKNELAPGLRAQAVAATDIATRETFNLQMLIVGP